MINALIPSGLNTKEFAFYGFLPLNKNNRRNTIKRIKKEDKTVILYEAPHKILKTLEDLQIELGDVICVLAHELTKIHEEFVRGSISSILEKMKEKDSIKGEYIILLDLNNNILDEEDEIKDKPIQEQYKIYEKQGMEKKEIIKQIAKNKNVAKNEIYKLFV